MGQPRLRVLAATAPHWPVRPAGLEVRSFTAGTPFSLQNAVRMAAGRAQARQGAWADSNWTTQEGRRESVLLLEFMEESREAFVSVLERLSPNLLLIGAMSLGMPGAIELARLARQRLGGSCLIVLGGKHCNETMEAGGIHPVAPVRLQLEGSIPAWGELPLFDLFIAGEGEAVIAELGERVSRADGVGSTLRETVMAGMESLGSSPGTWRAAWNAEAGIQRIDSCGTPLDLGQIPTAPSLFGLQSAFPVFRRAPTGHAFSDLGFGCPLNCWFCSERKAMNPLPGNRNGPARLYQHLQDIWTAGGEGKAGPTGAFVEDSILLRGDESLILDLLQRLSRNPLPGLSIGCQLTVNDINAFQKSGLLRKMRHQGFTYVAFGMETTNEQIAHRMSKRQRYGTWLAANQKALEGLLHAGLKAGIYILWGLGETAWERAHHLQQLDDWQEDYGGQPCAVGLNWATAHPANMRRGGPVPTFLEWGTDETSPLLPFLVECFGEASEHYSLKGKMLKPSEIPALRELFDKL